MEDKGSDPRYFVAGLVAGVVLLGFFAAVAFGLGLPSGFYGVPPNGTWYHPAPGHAAAPAAAAVHH